MRNLLLLLFTIAALGVSSQSISVSETDVQIEGSISDTDLHSYITVKNTGTEEISLLWDRNIVDKPGKWITWICDANNCYVNTVDECPSNKPNVMAPGAEFSLEIHVNPRNTDGSANITMELFDSSDTTLILETITLNFQAEVTTSTEEVSKEAIKVYPNPTVDFFQINTPDVDKVTIYNIVGGKMVEFDAYPNKNYDVTTLKEGMYLVRMTDDQNNVLKTVRLSKR